VKALNLVREHWKEKKRVSAPPFWGIGKYVDFRHDALPSGNLILMWDKSLYLEV
jgi:hypothetical protein